MTWSDFMAMLAEIATASHLLCTLLGASAGAWAGYRARGPYSIDAPDDAGDTQDQWPLHAPLSLIPERAACELAASTPAPRPHLRAIGAVYQPSGTGHQPGAQPRP